MARTAGNSFISHDQPIIGSLLSIIGTLLCVLPIFSATVQLKVSTIENSALQEAGVRQPFLLHVIVNNATNTAQYPLIKNIEKYNVRRTGFHMNMINGNIATTYSYQVRIDEAGTYTLGPAQITETHGIVESEPLTITVAPEQKTLEHTRAHQKSKSSFLRLTCDKEKLMVGEKAHCTLTFYTSDPMVSLQSLIEPDNNTTQNVIIKNKVEPLSGTTTINGAEHRYAQWSWDIYPTKPGTLVIPAYATDYTTQNHHTMFSILFAPAHLKRIYSNTITIVADPLPMHTQRPMLIGTIEHCTAKIEPPHAQVDQGTVLSFTITGTGDFEAMPFIPLQAVPDQLKWYESKQYTTSGNGPTTTHTIEYIVQALLPGTYHIPAQEIFYFDTRDRQYKTYRCNAVSLHISKSHPSSPSTAGKKANEKQAVSIAPAEIDDIRPLAKNGPWTSAPLQEIPWPLFWLMSALLAIAWLLFTLLTTNQRWIYKKIAAWNTTRTLYSKTKKLIKQAHASGNYGALYGIFIHFFSAHYAIPVGHISPEVIEEKLRASGLSASALQEWKIFFIAIAELGFYQQSKDPSFYSALYEQALYWIDAIETLSGRNNS